MHQSDTRHGMIGLRLSLTMHWLHGTHQQALKEAMRDIPKKVESHIDDIHGESTIIHLSFMLYTILIYLHVMRNCESLTAFRILGHYFTIVSIW